MTTWFHSPLPSNGCGFWNNYNLAPQFITYPAIFRLEGALNEAALQDSFNAILRRHEALRTSFATVAGQPVAAIAAAPTEPYRLTTIDLRNLPDTERQTAVKKQALEEMRRPFDLGRWPLLRTTLLQLGEEEYILLIILHHMIADGWSLGLLSQELAAFYEIFAANKPDLEQTTLPELPIQYADFAAWQRQQLQEEGLETQLSYWRRQLSGNLPVLQLPSDRPRPSSQSFEGKSRSLVLSQTLE